MPFLERRRMLSHAPDGARRQAKPTRSLMTNADISDLLRVPAEIHPGAGFTGQR